MFGGNKNEDPKPKTNVIILKKKTEYPKDHAKQYSMKHHENYPKNHGYGHKSKDHENSGGYKTKKCFNCRSPFTNPSYARKCPGIYPIPYPGAGTGTS